MPTFSGNHRHGRVGTRIFRTKAYSLWLLELQGHFPATPVFSSTDRLELEVCFKFKDHRRRDLDNCLKSLMDGMSGRVFTDDSQVCRIIAEKSVSSDATPKITITVRQLSSSI